MDSFKLENMVPFQAGAAVPRIIIPGDDGALLAFGTSVPSSVPGYAKGGIFIDTYGAKSYTNTGTAASCTFTSNT